MIPEDKLPDKFKKAAFHPSHYIYAWKRTHLEKLFEEFLSSNLAILGVEVWLVEDGQTQALIPLKNGEIKNFEAKFERKKGEEGFDFAERSNKAAQEAVNLWDLEKNARLGKNDKIFYYFKLYC
jgi:hypothetical protein